MGAGPARLASTPLKNIRPKTAANSSLPSARIESLTLSKTPVQSSPRCRPKNGLVQPAGTCDSTIPGETVAIATTPMLSAVTVRIVNCITSVETTLNMPPLIA